MRSLWAAAVLVAVHAQRGCEEDQPEQRRYVVDPSTEPDVQIVFETHRPALPSAPVVGVADAAKYSALCDSNGDVHGDKWRRVCPNMTGAARARRWWTCESRQFVAAVPNGTLDNGGYVPGLVYDRARTFPVVVGQGFTNKPCGRAPLVPTGLHFPALTTSELTRARWRT